MKRHLENHSWAPGPRLKAGQGAGRGPGGPPHNISLALLLLLCALPAMAAVTGKVVNGTTGQPQPGATVALSRLSENGVEPLEDVKSDAQGNFTINQNTQGTFLLRTTFGGVSYNRVLPPDSPTTGLNLEVFNASSEPGAAKVWKHMLFFEPGGGKLSVTETVLFKNDGKTSWHNPAGGTLRFYMPKEAGGKAQVNATAPGGMAIPASVAKTAQPDIYSVDFPIKPGETSFNVVYSVPYTSGAPYQGRIVTDDENTYLIAPNGITLAGDNLNDLGAEPRTQAHIFGLPSKTYKVTLSGETVPAPAAAAETSEAQDSGPQIEQILPRVNGSAPLILALALGILALGFALLYRAPAGPAKESNERGRR
jgi:hypothetical protein